MDTVASDRQDHIDLFRGIGIFLMVICHVGFGNTLYKFSHAFHMPMFFVIAGYFFSFPQFGDFIKKKVKTLLVPYVVFGILQYGIWFVLHRADSIQEKMLHFKSLLITNTDGNLVGGALWFLTCLFFAELIYYGLNRYFKNKIVISGACALIGIAGTFYIDIFSVRLFWGIDSALVGVVLIHIGHLLREEKFHKLMDLKLTESFILLLIGNVIATLNGPINMRTLEFSNPILFWLAVLMLIIAIWNLCRYIAKVKVRGIKYGIVELEFIGKNSIVYVCLNQFFISAITVIIPLDVKFVYQVIIFVLTMVLLRIASLIIIKTKLKVLVGKW